MINVLLFILVLGPSVYDISEGCGRVPSTPAPPTPTKASVNASDRYLECTDHEKNSTNCMNGGNCFVMVIDGERVANCHCLARYIGKRCLEIDFDFSTPPIDNGHVATAGIAASVAVLVVIVVVFTGVAIVYYKRKREEREAREKASERNAGANGSLLPQNHIQPRKLHVDKLKYGNGNHVPIGADEKFLSNYKVTEYKKEFEFKTTSV